jgi:hypothetical protein
MTLIMQIILDTGEVISSWWDRISPISVVKPTVRSAVFLEVLTVCGTFHDAFMFHDGIRGSRNPKIEKIPKKFALATP